MDFKEELKNELKEIDDKFIAASELSNKLKTDLDNTEIEKIRLQGEYRHVNAKLKKLYPEEPVVKEEVKEEVKKEVKEVPENTQ